jgi:hypothetical protein
VQPKPTTGSGRLFRVAVGVLAFMLCGAISLPTHAEEPKLDEAASAVQGKWMRRVQTPDGPVRIVKEHRGYKTFLSAEDSRGNMLYAHESEFRLEQLGKVRVFTFFNSKVTAGPNAGRVVKEPTSYVYRVDKNHFYEANGLMDNDTASPHVIVWDRQEN